MTKVTETQALPFRDTTTLRPLIPVRLKTLGCEPGPVNVVSIASHIYRIAERRRLTSANPVQKAMKMSPY